MRRLRNVAWSALAAGLVGCGMVAHTMGEVSRTIPASSMTVLVRAAAQSASAQGFEPRYVNVGEGHVQAYLERDVDGSPIHATLDFVARDEGRERFHVRATVYIGQEQAEEGHRLHWRNTSNKEQVDQFMRRLEATLAQYGQ
jgi:hypothetical protein